MSTAWHHSLLVMLLVSVPMNFPWVIEKEQARM